MWVGKKRAYVWDIDRKWNQCQILNGRDFFIIQVSVLPTERYPNLSQAMKISVKMETHGRFIYMRLYETEHMYTM